MKSSDCQAESSSFIPNVPNQKKSLNKMCLALNINVCTAYGHQIRLQAEYRTWEIKSQMLKLMQYKWINLSDIICSLFKMDCFPISYFKSNQSTLVFHQENLNVL